MGLRRPDVAPLPRQPPGTPARRRSDDAGPLSSSAPGPTATDCGPALRAPRATPFRACEPSRTPGYRSC